MLDLINKLFDKHTWFNLLIVLMIMLTIFAGFVMITLKYPIVFSVTNCIVRDETYETHDKTYRTYSELLDTNGVRVHVSITDTIKTKRNNLVEKPIS